MDKKVAATVVAQLDEFEKEVNSAFNIAAVIGGIIAPIVLYVLMTL